MEKGHGHLGNHWGMGRIQPRGLRFPTPADTDKTDTDEVDLLQEGRLLEAQECTGGCRSLA